jgi:RNA polymerase sigma-70 factor (ECF subfamily)
MTMTADALTHLAFAPVATRRDSPESTLDPRPAMPVLSRSEARRFERIVLGNVDFVWRSIRRLGIPARDVDDAVQQVFIVAASKLPAIAHGSERAFLFSTASRVAANVGRLLRRRSRTIVHVGGADAPDSFSEEPSPEDLSDMLRGRALMDRVLGEMPSKLREVFVLFELEELAVAEVASLLSVPIGTVGSRLRRARADFKARSRRLLLRLA